MVLQPLVEYCGGIRFVEKGCARHSDIDGDQGLLDLCYPIDLAALLNGEVDVGLKRLAHERGAIESMLPETQDPFQPVVLEWTLGQLS